MALPEQQGPVPRQRPARPVTPVHRAAAPRRRDEGLRRLPRRPVGPGQPRPGVHPDAVRKLPHGHALDKAGPLAARYARPHRQALPSSLIRRGVSPASRGPVSNSREFL